MGMRNGYELSPSAAANFTRRNLMDYLASMINTPYAAHGYGGFFTTSIMDQHYKPDMTRQQAYNLIMECVKEVQKRLVLNLPNFAITVVDKDGIHKMDPITSKMLAANPA